MGNDISLEEFLEKLMKHLTVDTLPNELKEEIHALSVAAIQEGRFMHEEIMDEVGSFLNTDNLQEAVRIEAALEKHQKENPIEGVQMTFSVGTYTTCVITAALVTNVTCGAKDFKEYKKKMKVLVSDIEQTMQFLTDEAKEMLPGKEGESE